MSFLKHLPYWLRTMGLSAQPSTTRMLQIAPTDPAVDARIKRNNHLATSARIVTSQHGEDGVIEEILRRLDITQDWCVEFGAYDGETSSNTRHLIREQGWKAVLIEPLSVAFARLEQNYKDLPGVHCINDIVSCSGDSRLDAHLGKTPIPRDFALLVIDIDGDDLHVWTACKNYRPKVVMIEFNPFIEADIHFVQPINADTRASASLRAICDAGQEKGYELICVVGGNAIFVLREYFPLFHIEDNRPQAMFQAVFKTRIFQGYDGTLYLAGERRLIWKHQIDRAGMLRNINITDEDIQALPRELRVFRPRLSYRNSFLEAHAGKLDMARVPGNILLRHQGNVKSECGEDGILAHVFETLDIKQGCCVEIGSHDGESFSNTWSLLNKSGWRGVLVEKDEEQHSVASARYTANKSVTLVHAEVCTRGRDTLDSVLKRTGIPKNFDFLCIDVEGNDYHLWASLTRYCPKVVMVDFNPTVPNDVIFIQQDSAEVNDGASLHALVLLARTKGYELAAVTTWNAIFVLRELLFRLDVTSNEIGAMYYPVFEMKIFQSLDNRISLRGCTRLVRHDYAIDQDNIQPLPADVRAMPGYSVGEYGKAISAFFAPTPVSAGRPLGPSD